MAKGKGDKGRYTPIRRKLIVHVMVMIGVLALLILPFELYRPIDKLERLVDNAKALIAGVEASLDRGELARMNDFVLRVMPQARELETLGPYLYVSFTMLITEGELVGSEEVQAALEEEGTEIENFDYRRLEEAAAFWGERFASDPGVDQVFARNKRVLLRAKERADEGGFAVADIYIMLDTGKKEGVFKEHIAFLLDGYQWWEEPAFAGELYQVSDNPYWRKSALNGVSEFGHDPTHDPDNYYLPRFTEDEWGTWFSVWRTIELDGVFDIVTIDLDASSVKETLFTVLWFVLGFNLLILLLVIGGATLLARTFTRPIRELSIGAEEVANGNYDYQVPVVSDDEMGELTRSFNEMARGQKERLNLRSTLEKLLSKELAETAGQHGLVLGGKRSDATLMFTDFAGFSTISQQMSPNQAVAVLNTYFETLIPVIKKHGGFPDKYIGDAIVAMFGAPIYFEDHADRAVRCAIEMQRALRALNRERIKNKEPVFEMRIGMNSGDVIVGAIGCDMKLEYTSIGETTNLANRMESACEIGHIMLARGTYKRLDLSRFQDVVIDLKPREVMVKGYDEPVSAYRVMIDKLRIAKRPGAEVSRFYRYAIVEDQSP